MSALIGGKPVEVWDETRDDVDAFVITATRKEKAE